MPTRIDNLTPYAAELLDCGGAAPTAGKGLVWDGEGTLVAADVVVQSDLSDYATISDVTSLQSELNGKLSTSGLAGMQSGDALVWDSSQYQRLPANTANGYVRLDGDGLIAESVLTGDANDPNMEATK